MLSIEEVVSRLERSYQRQRRSWLKGDGFPLSIGLKAPQEQQALASLGTFQTWLTSWMDYMGPGDLQMINRNWPSLGRQALPHKLKFSSPEEVCRLISRSEEWEGQSARYRYWHTHDFLNSIPCEEYDTLLLKESQEDFEHYPAVLQWLLEDKQPPVYFRQCPLEGIHSKWLEQRWPFLKRLITELRPNCSHLNDRELWTLLGLKSAPRRLRFRFLDDQFPLSHFGLSDLELPLEDLIQLELKPSSVFIVENRISALALPPMKGAMAIMELGYAVDVLTSIPFLQSVPVYYWGDIDTHGLAILNLARKAVPHLRSILMDTETLRTCRHLCTTESQPHRGTHFDHLDESEQCLMRDLMDHRWGKQLRLEQERIPWSIVLKALWSVQ
jgi:hypothetical protein